MTFFSLANVLVSYHLSRHQPRFAWIVAGAAVCQAIALALVPADLRTFLWVNAGVGLALIVAHELVMGSSARAVRAGATHAWAELSPKIRVRERLAAARRPLLEAAGVIAAYTGLAVLVTWPLASDVSGQVLGGGGDVLGTVADFWRQAELTGYHVTGATHVWMTGAPYGWELGNGVNIQSALVYYPAYLLTLVAGPVVAYNAAAFSGLVLSAAAMYWLARRLTGSALIAGWAGLVFMVFPWHMSKAEAHASLAHLEGFPILALALLAWYRRPDWTRAALIALAVLILWTTSGYYGVIGLVAVLFLVPLTALFQRGRFGGRALVGRMAGAIGGALFVGAVIFGIASLGKARGEIAPERGVHDLAWYGARIWEFFTPAWDNLLTGDATYSFLAAAAPPQQPRGDDALRRGRDARARARLRRLRTAAPADDRRGAPLPVRSLLGHGRDRRAVHASPSDQPREREHPDTQLARLEARAAVPRPHALDAAADGRPRVPGRARAASPAKPDRLPRREPGRRQGARRHPRRRRRRAQLLRALDLAARPDDEHGRDPRVRDPRSRPRRVASPSIRWAPPARSRPPTTSSPSGCTNARS